MPTFSAVYPLKTSWQLQLDVTVGAMDIVNNRHAISWDLYMRRGNNDYPFNSQNSPASVSGPGGKSITVPPYNNPVPGNIGNRWHLGSGSGYANHNPDGTGSYAFTFTHAASATLGTASGSTGAIALPRIPRGPRIKNAGSYKPTVQYIKIGGLYKVAIPFIKTGGLYKIAGG